jgi:N-carbamoyl-L-amino-acid hydrolase
MSPIALPARGERVLRWADALARHSDHAEHLTCAYMTPAHRAVAALLETWMREAGFDEVRHDAVGNVIGRYHAAPDRRDAMLVATGSHYDTVRNGGRYDGRLGILLPISVVAGMHRAGRRLPYDLEVVAFAEEEGARFGTSFLASKAYIGQFDGAWLDLADAKGVTMREAMAEAGLDPAAIPDAAVDSRGLKHYFEVHIEQGPVLLDAGLPLGVVTSIAGYVRRRLLLKGRAGHAGTTPMSMRHDAACAAAELALHVERSARAVPDAVGTVGILEVPAGSVNVVPGRCRFTLDLRATTDAARDALAAEVEAALERIARQRSLAWRLERTMLAPAAPSDPAWQQRWEAAVAALGLPVHRLPSGAGHDAMKLHQCMPQAMLFVRGQNGGISHNPLEAVTADDAELAVQAFLRLLLDAAAAER